MDRDQALRELSQAQGWDRHLNVPSHQVRTNTWRYELKVIGAIFFSGGGFSHLQEDMLSDIRPQRSERKFRILSRISP